MLDALDGIVEALLSDVRAVIKACGASKWKIAKIREKVAWAMARQSNRVDREMIRLAGLASSTAADYSQRLQDLKDETIPLTGSEVFWKSKGATGAAQAARALMLGKTAGAVEEFAGKLALSKQLHTLAPAQANVVAGKVIRSILEGRSLNNAGRELVMHIKGFSSGSSVSRIAQLIAESNNHAHILDVLLRGAKTHDPQVRQIVSYLRRLKHTVGVGGDLKVPGRVLTGYLKLTQDLATGAAPEKALKSWLHYKQRYNAERIIITESAKAYNNEVVNQMNELPWITHMEWQLNRGLHSRWKATMPKKRRQTKACVCDSYAGQIFPKEETVDLLPAHPHCGCSWRPVVNREMMLASL